MRVEYVSWISPADQFSIIPAENLQAKDNREKGLKGEYFSNLELEGEPIVTRVDKQIDFDWENQAPDPNIVSEQFSIRWSGKLVPSLSGQHELSVDVRGGVRLYLNGDLLIDQSRQQHRERQPVHVTLEAVIPMIFKWNMLRPSKSGAARLE